MGTSVLPFAGLIIQISKERPARSRSRSWQQKTETSGRLFPCPWLTGASLGLEQLFQVPGTWTDLIFDYIVFIPQVKSDLVWLRPKLKFYIPESS